MFARPIARHSLPDFVQCVAPYPDGTEAAVTFASGKEVRILDLATGVTVRRLEVPSRDEIGLAVPAMYSVAVSPDGKYLAALGDEACVLWQTNDYTVCYAWAFPLGQLRGLVFAADARHLYTIAGAGSGDPVILRLDVKTHESKVIYRETENRLFPLQKMVRITALALSADGNTLAVGTGGGVVLADASTGATKRGLEASGLSPPGRLAFSPDGKLLAAAGGPISIFDTSKGNMVAQCQTQFVTGLAFSSDGSFLVSAGEGVVNRPGHVQVWRIPDGKGLARITCHTSSIRSLSIVPNTQRFLTGSDDNTLQVWDLTEILENTKSEE